MYKLKTDRENRQTQKERERDRERCPYASVRVLSFCSFSDIQRMEASSISGAPHRLRLQRDDEANNLGQHSMSNNFCLSDRRKEKNGNYKQVRS